MNNSNQIENKKNAKQTWRIKLPQGGEALKIDPWWGLVVLVLALILFLLLRTPNPYQRILRFCSDGIGITLFVTLTSFVLTMVLGLLGGLGRISNNKVIYGLTSLYVEVIRGVPLLVQLLIWYFAMPSVIMSIGEQLNFAPMKNYLANPVLMAVIGISVCYAAYMTEIVRAGVESLPKGQLEAAHSLGMNRVQALRYVILPQAYRVIMPAIGNELIALLKDSSLVSVVSVADLTRRGREFMSNTFLPIETWIMIALIYLFLTLVTARIMSIIEKKTSMES